MITKERVEAVLDRARPFMQADSGDIEVLDVEAGEHQQAFVAVIRLIDVDRPDRSTCEPVGQKVSSDG
jgi:hypothetical protein